MLLVRVSTRRSRGALAGGTGLPVPVPVPVHAGVPRANARL